jgi:hypothetical protein
MKTQQWYKVVPVGRNVISSWTKDSALKLGLDSNKITNHSNRSTAVTSLAKSGVNEQQLIKITGHSNTNSIKPYLSMDKQHHSQLIENLRKRSVEQDKNEKKHKKTKSCLLEETSQIAPMDNVSPNHVPTNLTSNVSNEIHNESTPKQYQNCTFYINCVFDKKV